MTIKDVQLKLLAMGYALPKFGADGFMGAETSAALSQYQRAHGLPVTGQPDERTLADMFKSDGAIPPASTVVPASWMPDAKMKGIICHWTAGSNTASDFDKAHYHILINGDGVVVRGKPTIDLNQSPVRAGYAAHTLNCNSGFIGVSLACMAGAIESPFNPGKSPMTRAQWDKLPQVLANLCARYNIPVTARTVLSHAEVQVNLGIKQKNKWDISRLAFDPSIVGAKACGDIFRASTSALLKG